MTKVGLRRGLLMWLVPALLSVATFAIALTMLDPNGWLAPKLIYPAGALTIVAICWFVPSLFDLVGAVLKRSLRNR